MISALRAIDIDMNRKVSLIEFLLWKYKKTVVELFTDKPGDIAHLLKALEEAIALYQKTLAEKEAREAKMAELEKIAEEGE